MTKDEAEAKLQAELTAKMFEGPAPLSNRFHVVQIGAVLRLSFGEQWDPAIAPAFRTALTLNINDAKELAKIVDEVADRALASFATEAPNGR